MSDEPPVPPARAKPYHHGDLRNALVAAGTALLREGGAANLDLRKVARRAGVSHAAPYRHFADKQALVAAVAEEGFGQLALRLDAALEAAAPEPSAQLHALGQAYVQFACDEPWLMREMFSSLTIERTAYPSLFVASKALWGRLLAPLQEGQAQGVIAPADIEQHAIALWSLLHGVAMLVIEQQFPAVVTEQAGVAGLVQGCLHTLFTGLSTEAPPGT